MAQDGPHQRGTAAGGTRPRRSLPVAPGPRRRGEGSGRDLRARQGAVSPRRSLESAFAAGDDADPTSAMDTGDDGALEPGQCTHCFCVTPTQKTNRFKCEECGLVSGKPEDSAVNAAIILKQTGSSAASGKSNKDDDSAPAVPKLSAVDKELTRLAEEGEPFARFDDKTPVSAETALHDIRESWCGASLRTLPPPSSSKSRAGS